jgi:hypothetical protein
MDKGVRPGDRVLLFHSNLEMAVEKSRLLNGDYAARFLAKRSVRWPFALSFLQIGEKVRRLVGDNVLNCLPKRLRKICKQPLNSSPERDLCVSGGLTKGIVGETSISETTVRSC